MKIRNHLKGFNEFSRISESIRINEMASELSKLGVSKEHMQFIHKLEGKKFAPRQGQKQLNPKTGKMDVEFHTLLEPHAAKKGPWPAREDVPLSHDVAVIGTKTGKRPIQHYLEEVIPKNKDTDTRLILVTPSIDMVFYITRKTGKTTPDERTAKYGIEDINKSRKASRFDPDNPVSEKLGMYMRVVAIDKDSSQPVAAWNGAIGQMIKQGQIDDSSVLYILEKEDRVRQKRGKRKSIKEVTEDQFLDYFIKNFENIASKLLGKTSTSARKELNDLKDELDLETADLNIYGDSIKVTSDFSRRMQELKQIIKSSGFHPESLKPKLHNFQELAMAEGEYEPAGEDYSQKDKASLTNMVEIHTLNVVASMFLHYSTIGKVSKQFHTDDPIKELGLEDLFD